ncbi:hypothetical protein HGRIS_001340 [Hohenbuehelia grisea]|uniref:non-specific serine/threonine protein kinase n=1 Tax=Hohenbuehelia grisea TaxID=104357 RepID=A0ABR3JQB7_9AGAR
MTPLVDTHFMPDIQSSLKSSRYIVLRKLGEGVTSSTWLVRDTLSSPQMYAAAKILTYEATADQLCVRELEFLQTITRGAETNDSEEGFEHLPFLYDHFTIDVGGPGNTAQTHLCLIQTLFSTSVSALRRSAPTQSLPIYMVRSFIYMTLQALQTLHSLHIIHTDLKLDNILFSNAQFSYDADLERYLLEHPAEVDSEGVPKSQPLPNEWTHETSALQAERMTVALVDYGHAEWAEKPMAKNFCPMALRPPEVILAAGVSTAVDIWAIGCLTFELLVGRWLFSPEDGGDDWTQEDDHLAKMMELTGQFDFPQSVLERSQLKDKYFDETGNLLRVPELIPVKLEDAISNYKIQALDDNDIREAADFIRSCLHLDWTQRKTAEELLKHPFALQAFS